MKAVDTPEMDLATLRRMDPARKLEVMNGLIREAYALTAAGVRARNPELSEEEIRARARALVGGERP